MTAFHAGRSVRSTVGLVGGMFAIALVAMFLALPAAAGTAYNWGLLTGGD
jgi:hypothetical protein